MFIAYLWFWPDLNTSATWCLWLFIYMMFTYLYLIHYPSHRTRNLRITTWNRKFSWQTSICGLSTFTWCIKILKYIWLVMHRIVPLQFKSYPPWNIAPENGWLEYYLLLLGWPFFRGHVSFREGKYWYWVKVYVFTAYLDFTKFCPVFNRTNPSREWQSNPFITSWGWSLILVKLTGY